ncbi:MAG: DUF1236 domain-containing protein [Pseudomonadota bacterium]|nr:DUF1236 domain-containing protein [Pseudomonadota bacterium]
MKKAYSGATAAFLCLLASPGLAQTAATATTDLNVRSGPGPQYEVIGVINANEGTTVSGCLEGSKWCMVMHSGGEGWVYSDYLTADLSGSAVVLTERYVDVGVPVVTYESSSAGEGVAAGAATGAVAGALIGGPIGAAVGAAAGAAAGGTAGAVIDPPETVRTYVTTNRVDPIYLEGEVVVGAGLPDTVELREIPEYEYTYVYVNGQPVLVEPSSRRIVYVLR